jgi:hypothetical protein
VLVRCPQLHAVKPNRLADADERLQIPIPSQVVSHQAQLHFRHPLKCLEFRPTALGQL